MGNELFETALPILNQIEKHHFEAYFVGGAVRDYIMHRTIHDIDITTSAMPDEIEDIFEHTIPIGKEHGTINVVFNNENYEVTTFRSEGDYLDHRRPSEVNFVRNLYEDVQRRDFTINAIAMDKNYKIFDYFGGQKDIQSKLIRTVGNPSERFKEDALRIIRGLRFQSQLTFDIHTETFEAMQLTCSDIEYLSIERIVVEFKKLILGSNVKQSYHNLLSLKIFNYIPFFNELDMTCVYINEPLEFEQWLAILLIKNNNLPSLKQLKISNKEKSDIHTYIAIIETLPQITTKDALKLFVYDYSDYYILKVLNIYSVLQNNQIPTASELIINSLSIKQVVQHLQLHERKEMDVNGKDLLAHFNKNGGPWLKNVLREIECAIVTDKIKNNKEEILKWVNENVKI